MHLRYFHFCLLLVLVVFSRTALSNYPSFAFVDEAQFYSLPLHADAETNLAHGLPLNFQCADEFHLQLIPGISRTLSRALVKQRAAVLDKSKALRPNEQYRSLEVVHGIGTKGAKKLGGFLSFEQRRECDGQVFGEQ